MIEKLKTFNEDLFQAFLEELLNKKLNYCNEYNSNFVLIGKTLRSISIFVLKKIKLLHYHPTLYYHFQSYIEVMLTLKNTPPVLVKNQSFVESNNSRIF